MNHPNPNVYRLAAERVQHVGLSCHAIQHALNALDVDVEDQGMYFIQYKLMFGPHIEARFSDDELYAQYVQQLDADHPFWNRIPTPKRQEMRRLALLLMADIVEHGSV